jgi:tetraacyldisaccharide 4'-kinase
LIINELKELSSKRKFLIKTICVGNIYLGGTGKTSLAIKIQSLLKKKIKAVFIKKNYIDQLDEINLLKTKGELISKNSREEALYLASKKKFKLAILDDGLQQKNINYDLKIICFNAKDGFGNNYLLASWPIKREY